MNYTVHLAGDQSVFVQFGKTLSDETNRKVRQFAELLTENNIQGIKDTVLGYTNVLINYDPMTLPYSRLVETIEQLVLEIDLEQEEDKRIVEISVLYGSKWGPDLKDVAEINGLTEDEVIDLHTQPLYIVYFLGFTPGFPFLGGMSPSLSTPRLSNPRMKIPGGSVGIANDQTGIYPISSPGGWRLIGRTPLLLYDPEKEWPFLLSPGDRIKFVPITEEEYERLQKDEKQKVL